MHREDSGKQLFRNAGRLLTMALVLGADAGSGVGGGDGIGGARRAVAQTP
ncbi:MAG: hypothetical protein H7Z41_16710, partial [Cytophagales bacterium]|nr:hypothetical protein [Armatimonadota bacterium]